MLWFTLTCYSRDSCSLSVSAKFLLESAMDLKQGLKAIGSDLLVTTGLTEDVRIRVG